ncbi:MAG: hypothetical protein AAFV53_27335 [Myxococcota bacterium]
MRRTLPLILLSFAAFACDSDAPDQQTDAPDGITEDVDMPTAYEYTPDEDQVSAEIDLDAAGAAIQGVLSNIHAYNAMPVLESYDHFMGAADDQCPLYYEQNGNAFWYSDCVSDEGMMYSGYAFYNLYEQENLFGDGNLWDAVSLSGTADMESGQGARFHLGGQAYSAWTSGNDGGSDFTVYQSSISGTFFDDSGERSGDWMSTGQTPTVSMFAAEYTDYGLRYMLVDGDAVLKGDVTAVSFENLLMYTYAPGFYPCREEPAGALSFRDAEGRWFEVTFDIDDNREVMPGGECDGCGMATHHGEVIGQLCIDASPLVSWEGTPW